MGDDDIEERLSAIEDRATKKLPEVPEWEYKRTSKRPSVPTESDRESYRGLGVGLSIAYGFVGPLIAGWGIGWLIDRQSGVSNVWQTWLTVVGMFVGFAWVVIVVTRLGNR